VTHVPAVIDAPLKSVSYRSGDGHHEGICEGWGSDHDDTKARKQLAALKSSTPRKREETAVYNIVNMTYSVYTLALSSSRDDVASDDDNGFIIIIME